MLGLRSKLSVECFYKTKTFIQKVSLNTNERLQKKIFGYSNYGFQPSVSLSCVNTPK